MPVILVISDFRILEVLVSKLLNSFSKNSIEESKSWILEEESLGWK